MSKDSINPFLELAWPGVRDLKPYVPGKPISELEREYGIRDSVKLASNENPLGPSPRAVAAATLSLGEITRYPDGNGFALKRALADRHGVDANRITLGNGSNDVLDLLARVFLGPGREAVFSQYAFAVYPIATQAVGATARVAAAHDGQKGPGYGHDLDAMRDLIGERTRLVFIANPNNPTGTWLRRDQLEAFLAAVPESVVVVVDEAYFEYVSEPDYPDASLWLTRFPNLVVTRTFSKAYGLAGLRVGYALSHPALADLLNRVRQPFNVNSVALAAAQAALEDSGYLQEVIGCNQRGMAQLCRGIESMGLSYIPSIGNFVCVDLGAPAQPVYEALLREGCITRPVANYGLPNHLRVSIGLETENSHFLRALARVMSR